MKISITLCLGLLVLLAGMCPFSGDGFSREKAQHQYIGVKICGICHKSPQKGNQLEAWQKSGHARAYQALVEHEKFSPELKAKLAERGIDPATAHKNPACLKCHVTGYGQPKEICDPEKVKLTDGVQCESCHGAGKDYAKVSIMKDRALSIANGLIIPTKEVCVRCHNAESPSYKGFDFEERYKKIAHPRPKD